VGVYTAGGNRAVPYFVCGVGFFFDRALVCREHGPPAEQVRVTAYLYLVAECMTMAAPSSSGRVPQHVAEWRNVLSTPSSTRAVGDLLCFSGFFLFYLFLSFSLCGFFPFFFSVCFFGSFRFLMSSLRLPGDSIQFFLCSNWSLRGVIRRLRYPYLCVGSQVLEFSFSFCAIVLHGHAT